jgi:hypothetical protein
MSLGVSPVDIRRVGACSAPCATGARAWKIELGWLAVCNLDANVGRRRFTPGGTEPSRSHGGVLAVLAVQEKRYSARRVVWDTFIAETGGAPSPHSA